MGTNFKCGCRCSQGEWLLCPEHEAMMLTETEIDYGEEDGQY